jgi:anti-sigma regulatory factor (Ser/Thr protein kinase)
MLASVQAALDLDQDPISARQARRFTSETLQGWGRGDLEIAAALLVTELVTNAVLHARTAVELRLEIRDDVLRLSVRDGSPIVPSLKNHGLEATTGRGLGLVATLARNWGVSPGDGGKTVWVELDGQAALEEVWDLEGLEQPATRPDPRPRPPGGGGGGDATVARAQHRATPGWAPARVPAPAHVLARCA